MIRVHNVHKSFAALQVLRGIDFDIQEGEYTALLGQNGAGKTTLLRIIASLSRPTSGEVSINEFSLPKQAEQVRRQMGVVSHDPFLYGDLTAEENLKFYGKLNNLENLQERVLLVLEQVDLSVRRYDLVRTFSRGMQQRLALARALLHEPDLLLLDEPFSGLDFKSSQNLTDLLNGLHAKGTTILMTTHDLDFAITHCKRLLLIKQGKLVKDTVTQNISRDELVTAFG